MKNPIVIAPKYEMAEYLCRQILRINPREHAMSENVAARQGLVGMRKPVVIMYLSDQSRLWKYNVYSEIEEILRICQATVIRIPEVMRVERNS